MVFIDELDAVGARRGMGYNDERDQTLNQLLTELDGFEGRPGVLFLAATNRMEVRRGRGRGGRRGRGVGFTHIHTQTHTPHLTSTSQVLDPALLRPGRLSRKVVVPLPDEPGRRVLKTRQKGAHLRLRGGGSGRWGQMQV